MALLTRLRILLPAAVCALAGHAVVYRTFWPSGPVHGYFAWYQPVFGIASALALVVLGAALVLGLRGSAVATRALRSLAPGSSQSPFARAHRLAIAALAVLLAQETVEASFAAGRPVPGAFSGPSVLLLVAFLWLLSLGLVLAARAYTRLAERVTSASRARLLPVSVPPASRAVFLARVRPLAAGRALRAPPLLPV